MPHEPVEALRLAGKPAADALTEQLHKRTRALKAQGITPHLHLIRVGERADDISYERGALKRAEQCGVEVSVETFDTTVTTGRLIDALVEVNHNDKIHGCMFFRPLPAHIDETRLQETLAVAKDVDGCTPGSLYGVFAGKQVGFSPITAEAVIELLDYYDVDLTGKLVTVVGRSLVIGKPLAQLLCARDATVTTCHSKTRSLAAQTRESDIVVAALGRARFITDEHVSFGQVVIDVGINWDEEQQRLVGDVDHERVAPVVAALSPVPAGVGSLTCAVLMKHVVEAAERSARL